MAQIDPVASKCRIELSRHFEPSVVSIGIDQEELDNRVDQFIKFKMDNGCSVAFSRYGEDKQSGMNRSGEIIRPYQDDHHWHCHLSISAPGDPMIAYRLLDTGHIRLVCITTHRQCFAQRADFIRQHADEFPKTIKRRPSLGRKK